MYFQLKEKQKRNISKNLGSIHDTGASCHCPAIQAKDKKPFCFSRTWGVLVVLVHRTDRCLEEVQCRAGVKQVLALLDHWVFKTVAAVAVVCVCVGCVGTLLTRGNNSWEKHSVQEGEVGRQSLSNDFLSDGTGQLLEAIAAVGAQKPSLFCQETKSLVLGKNLGFSNYVNGGLVKVTYIFRI